ncbi:hypothetical protein T12_8809 [Trichinella patagoniensis]|uniref:Uncharacterized protein n=2 Tax=Trichinella TaxID=6333 RepID=A0A0V0ZYF8_9BILA|nr:hypothetical protein T05_7365 [Trichinella murrelli]KRY17583.1 hypothetical protein T12_8809 [Trichinella patagoniensis]KRZ88757.1 hypothetical protein T08_14226 [Trichinella sp. T8]
MAVMKDWPFGTSSLGFLVMKASRVHCLFVVFYKMVHDFCNLGDAVDEEFCS